MKNMTVTSSASPLEEWSFSDVLRAATSRCILAMALLHGTAIDGQAGAADPTVAKTFDDKSDRQKLVDVKADLDHAAKGLDVLKYASMMAIVKDPTVGAKATHTLASKFNGAASKLSSGIGKVIEQIDDQDDEGAESTARSLQKESKEVLSSTEQLTLLARRIEKMPVGIVAESSDPKFVVSIELLSKNPDEALRRLTALGNAMEQNIRNLEAQQTLLEKIDETADTTGKALRRLEDAMYELGKVPGAYSEMMYLQGIEAYNLAKLGSDVESAAATKLEKVKGTLEVEKKRLENLDTNLETFWGATR